MNQFTFVRSLYSVAIVAIALGSSAPAVWAEDNAFEEADVYAELNNTDGDLGFHGLVDGDAWKKLTIRDPNHKELVTAKVKGQMKRQGLTEFFFESAEPSFDDLSPEEFFDRFPEGTYIVEGVTLDGTLLENTDLFWHVMPAPPEPLINGLPMAIQCDEDEPGYDITEVEAPVTVAWADVVTSHPTIGTVGTIEVARYQFVVEVELEVEGEEFTSVYSVDLPPDVTSMSIPQEILDLGDEFKYEILVKEATGGNQTAVESCFELE